MTIETISAWEDKLALRRSFVLFTTLWLTWDAFHWATIYALSAGSTDALGKAAIIGAVTAPVTYLQKVVFEAYISAKDPS
jgi:hypothetical protein